jgi:hypothetical protein
MVGAGLKPAPIERYINNLVPRFAGLGKEPDPTRSGATMHRQRGTG